MKKREFIVQDLLSKIYQKEYLDDKLPNQRELAKLYDVSRYTVQKAIKNLEEIGIVYTVQGSGIFISKKYFNNPLVYNSLTQTPYNRIESKMLELIKKLPTLEEQKIFKMKPDEELWQFVRIRIVNYKIQQMEISKLPVSMFPELSKKVIERSIQKYVEEKGYRISHYITGYKPISLDKEQAKTLLCKKGSPAMEILNRAILESGEVFEYSKIIAIDYSVTYIRPFDRENHQSRVD